MQKGIFKIKRTVSLKVDDPVDAVAVHFARGLVGMIASPIFMNNGIYVYFFKEFFYVHFATFSWIGFSSLRKEPKCEKKKKYLIFFL